MRAIALLLVLALAQAAHGQSSLLIEADAPGWSAGQLKGQVLVPLDVIAVFGGDDIQRTRSLALDGRCYVRLDLTQNADPLQVRRQVDNGIAAANKWLPPGSVVRILPQTESSFFLIAFEPAPALSLADLSNKIKKTIQPAVAGLPGVVQVRILGDTQESMRITLDPEKLKANRLSEDEVADSLAAAKKKGTAADLEKTPIASRGDRTICLPDIASLKLAADEPREETGISFRGDKVGSRRAVYLLVQATSGSLDSVKKGLEKTLKPSADFSVELRLLKKDQTTVVMRLPDDMDREKQKAKVQAALKAMTALPQVREVFWIMRPDDHEAVFYVMVDRAQKAAPPEPRKIAELIKQLESDQAGVRDAAHARLAELAELAEPMLRQRIALSPSPELEQRLAKLLAKLTDDRATRQRHAKELPRALRTSLARIEEIRSRVGGLYSPFLPWPGDGCQFVVSLRGNDFAKLQTTAQRLTRKLTDARGFVDIDQFPRMRQVVSVIFDAEKLRSLGLGLGLFDIADALGGDEWPISGWPWPVVLYVQSANKTPKQATDPVLRIRTSVLGANGKFKAGERKLVPLRDVATIETVTAPSGILREDGKSCVVLFGNLDGRTLEEGRAEIRRITAELGKDIEFEVE